MKLFKIALPVPIDSLFTYIIPANLWEDKLIGRRALVPFGTRILTGVIIEEDSEKNDFKYKEIIDLHDSKPIFSEKMLKLTRWMSNYYLCSWGETLKAAIPQGMSPETVLKIKLIENITKENLKKIALKSPKKAELLSYLMNHDKLIALKYIERDLNTKFAGHLIESLEQADIIETERVLTEHVKPKIQNVVKIVPELLSSEENLSSVLDELSKRNHEQARFLSSLYTQQLNHEFIVLSDLIRLEKLSLSSAKSLQKKGIVEIYKSEVQRNGKISLESLAKRDESILPLTNEQQLSLDKIVNSIDSNEFKPYLLYGITGSGKTLVYIHAIKHCLSQNKSSLLMVPEISLTPQLIDRFQLAFHDEVAVLHSKMSEGERYDAWRSIQKGKAKIVIGARSSIFAPLNNVGLIIVDEEHEQSYKQDSPSPRYQGRDAAVMRAKYENCTVILGSGTPSIESMHNTEIGRYELLEIKDRADGAKLPSVKIIDMGDAYKQNMVHGSFSKALLDKIYEKIQKNESVILFHNRRGFSPILRCKPCSFVHECTHCSIKLTYHKQRNQLRCHYCGYTIPADNQCPDCHNLEWEIIGYGTQRIEEELNEYLSTFNITANIGRIDLDTTSKKGSQRKILQSFSNGDTNILIGTQMVAKGLDFENVTLVGVVNGDLQLFQPDFRASERTFQLLTQVAGRAGRSQNMKGEVLIQSFNPNNFAIKYAMMMDYKSFYNEESQNRKDANYPPYSRFSIVEMTSENEDLLDYQSEIFKKLLDNKSKSIEVLGPNTPNLFKIKNKFRRIIIIKNDKTIDPTGKELKKIIRDSLETFNKEFSNPKIVIKIDIDAFSEM